MLSPPNIPWPPTHECWCRDEEVQRPEVLSYDPSPVFINALWQLQLSGLLLLLYSHVSINRRGKISVSTQSSFYLTEYQVHAPRGALTGAQDPNGAPTDIQGSKPVLVFYFD